MRKLHQALTLVATLATTPACDVAEKTHRDVGAVLDSDKKQSDMPGLHSNPTKVNSTRTLENDHEVLLTKAFELIKSYSDDYESSFEYKTMKDAVELVESEGADENGEVRKAYNQALRGRATKRITSYSDDYESSFEYGVAKEAIELAKDNGVDVSDLEAKLESLRIEKEST